MIYVYGIVEAGNEPGEVPRGLGGAEVDYAARGDVAGVFSSTDASAIEPTEALLWDHERVVETLMQSGPVLP
ncbi:MAG: GvpL/GvpF family gas vesicle protein, partial [Actinomycetota bacterium]